MDYQYYLCNQARLGYIDCPKAEELVESIILIIEQGLNDKNDLVLASGIEALIHIIETMDSIKKAKRHNNGF